MLDEFAKHIVETVREPLLILDHNLHVVATNHSFHETFQVSSEEVKGRFIYDLGNGEWDIPHLRYLLEDIIKRETTVESFEVEHVFQHLGLRTMLLNARRVNEVEAANYSILLAIEDITERRIIERELAVQAQELGRSNADLQQFAYVASHDLQEPLRMVTSYLKLLEKRYKDRLDSDANEFIGFAVDGATRMQVLIDDLLAYSRVGTKGISFIPTPCEAILERVLKYLELAIRESGSIITSDPLPTVLGDASQLTQVFQNLIANAVKFRGDQPLQLHVSAFQLDDVWQFSVRDNGLGFSPEFSERVFVIFQRLYNRTEYTGTGIGLAICKKIVERHGGRIWVEAEEGSGCTFFFTIPIQKGV